MYFFIAFRYWYSFFFKRIFRLFSLWGVEIFSFFLFVILCVFPPAKFFLAFALSNGTSYTFFFIIFSSFFNPPSHEWNKRKNFYDIFFLSFSQDLKKEKIVTRKIVTQKEIFRHFIILNDPCVLFLFYFYSFFFVMRLILIYSVPMINFLTFTGFALCVPSEH